MFADALLAPATRRRSRRSPRAGVPTPRAARPMRGTFAATLHDRHPDRRARHAGREPRRGGHARARQRARRSSRCCRSPRPTIRWRCCRRRAQRRRDARHRRRRADLLRPLRRDAVQSRGKLAEAGPRRGASPASTCRCWCARSPTARRAWRRWSRRRSPAAAKACCTSRSIPSMQQREVEIVNKLGLHARASAKLTQLAAKYQSDVADGAQRPQGQREEHHGRDDARGRQGRRR